MRMGSNGYMMIVNNLRPYQKVAHDIIVEHLKKSTASIVLDAVTAAGKSWIIAAVAESIKKASGKHILCVAPNSDLVTQNRSKYLTTGEPASIYSASLGVKCLKHDVIFATPLSLKSVNDDVFKRFALIVIDEAHGITPSIKEIIERAKVQNPMIRILGLTGTPYRLGSGYIYKQEFNKKVLTEDVAKNPYFDKLVHRISGQELLKLGFITPVEIGQIGEHYDNINHLIQKNGKFSNEDIANTFLGKGRKTAFIIAEIAEYSKDRKGVMIFASTVQHAQEIMDSLPSNNAMMIGGDINTSKEQRKKLVSDFKNQKYKYLVSVATMTTGVDFTHVDVIALLRPTESASLLTQIIGRGLRLHEGKINCLLLDYAGNLDSHFPDSDIFSPNIKTFGGAKSEEFLEQKCPQCEHTNIFSYRKNEGGYKINTDGYFTDLMGTVITTSKGDPLPAHYGRRCNGIVPSITNFEGVRCGYRWSMKVCEACNAENDIAARRCTECKGELIDPNEKLIIEFKQLKRDPTRNQVDEVLQVEVIPTVSQAGNPCLRVEFLTPYRKFQIWLQVEAKNERAVRDYRMFKHYENNIQSVEYKKETSGFYRVINYNLPIQEIRE